MRPWQRWALQIARALDSLHSCGMTHMDLKPGNIVISATSDVVLIDMSGRAVSQAWLSPEMWQMYGPWTEDLTSRIQNVIWAFGKIVLQMSDVTNREEENSCCAMGATADQPPRTSLQAAISQLRRGLMERRAHGSHSIQC